MCTNSFPELERKRDRKWFPSFEMASPSFLASLLFPSCHVYMEATTLAVFQLLFAERYRQTVMCAMSHPIHFHSPLYISSMKLLSREFNLQRSLRFSCVSLCLGDSNCQMLNAIPVITALSPPFPLSASYIYIYIRGIVCLHSSGLYLVTTIYRPSLLLLLVPSCLSKTVTETMSVLCVFH